MKKIEAIIRKEKLERVKMLLATLGYHGMTVSEVSGLGSREENLSKAGSREHRPGFLIKLKIELVINDDDVSQVLSAIVRGAKTGEMDDGNIFVIHIEGMVKVCTADYGINAV